MKDHHDADTAFHKKTKWMQGAVNPARVGEFTAKAHRAGMGVQEYARHVKSKRSRADAHTKHQAQFAINAAKVARRRK